MARHHGAALGVELHQLLLDELEGIGEPDVERVARGELADRAGQETDVVRANLEVRESLMESALDAEGARAADVHLAPLVDTNDADRLLDYLFRNGANEHRFISRLPTSHKFVELLGFHSGGH